MTDLGSKQCDACGIKFVEFRNSGRLGCPHDYDSFHEELQPLLDNIHGDSKHTGKQPRRLPTAKAAQHELAALRRQLQTAITKEQYEEAAKLRGQAEEDRGELAPPLRGSGRGGWARSTLLGRLGSCPGFAGD